MSKEIGKNMLLTGAVWGERDSFKLIPASLDSPYVEGIYDCNTKTLIMIAKDKKNIFHMMDRLDDNGEKMTAKIKKANGSPYKQERKTVETFQEHYILDVAQQISFIETFAINADTFPYKKFTEPDADVVPSPIILKEVPKLEIVKEIPKEMPKAPVGK
jgi:hypothetical protein